MTAPSALLLATIAVPEPIGRVSILSDGRSVVALEFGAPEHRLLPMLRARFGANVTLRDAEDPQGFASAVRAYFDGRLDAIDSLPTDGGGSPFQQRVWALLRTIPTGETRSYGQLATLLGQPGAARAVGLANGRNPISLIVPCHRVIGAAGTLTGYGGGIDRKRWLLAHERSAGGGATGLLL